MTGRGRIVVATALCCLALQTVGCTTGYGTTSIGGRGVAMTPAAHTVVHATPSPAARACGGLPKFDKATADEIMSGQLTIAPFPAATIDPSRDGDINWKLNPFNHPTWFGDFQSGGWIETLVSGYLAGGPQAAAYRARAEAITETWLRGVPLTARDPGTLICISEAFPGQAWIQNQIVTAVNYYTAHWMGAWNHGLKQDLELLQIGCAYPAQAFGGAALRWRQTAVRQMIASFEPNPLGPSIDAQGVVNEQATLYEDFVYNLWQSGQRELAACGYQLPAWIRQRIALMPAFLGYATQPDGNLVQIGDTYVEHPKTSPRQPRLDAVYADAGYVFGRSGWGPGASYYSLRFGPGRQVHGHDDHMGLTYYARGRNLIVNAGHTGYENTPYRAFLRSPEASSMLVMPGVPFSAAATSLVTDRIGRYGQFYEFHDTAFGGHPRYRSVYVSQRPDLVLAFDRASGARSYEQLWHLDPAFNVTSLTSSEAIASAPGTELDLIQIALPGQVIPPGSTTVVQGQVNPYQGWVSHQMLQRIPADVVTMTRTGPSAAMLTLIAPEAPGTTVTTAISGPPGGPYRLSVWAGLSMSAFTITADGSITS